MARALGETTRAGASPACFWAASLLLLGACSSDVGFRRFEVGPVEPEVVFQTALEVVRDFYTQTHKGIAVLPFKEDLAFETSWIERRSISARSRPR